MALIKDKPKDIPEAAPELDPQYDDTPPAFLAFGRSHAEIDNPPQRGEIRTYLVRVKCTGEHEDERSDGEIRHSRKLKIITCWQEGTPKPPDADEQQPGLYDNEDSHDD